MKNGLESLNRCSNSSERIYNTIIPPQSHPEATLLLAGDLVCEMLHEFIFIVNVALDLYYSK